MLCCFKGFHINTDFSNNCTGSGGAYSINAIQLFHLQSEWSHIVSESRFDFIKMLQE